MVNHRLWSNLRSCFALKRKGFPVGQLRFKSRNQFKTLCYNQSGFKIDSKERRLILSKVGQLSIRLHRQIMGQVKGVLVKKYASGKWFAILQVETEEAKPAPRRGRAIGLDVGLTHFITDSEGRHIENPRFYEKSLQRIKLLHRKLSRKVKGSKNWEKNRLLLARVYETLLNRRNDFLHKLSHFYANNYDIIAVENLQIKNMVKNRTLSQKILDVSWAKFFTLLSFKAESAGRLVVKIDPKGTSQTYLFGELDRDYNAALNIYHRGLGQPYQPVKRGPLRQISAQAVIVGQVVAMNQEAPQI
jgi:putative transposase